MTISGIVFLCAIGFLILSLIFCFIGAFLEKEKHMDKVIIAFIIISMFSFLIWASIETPTIHSNKCDICNQGTYQYIESVGHRISTSHIYKCNYCGNMIETNHFLDNE